MFDPLALSPAPAVGLAVAHRQMTAEALPAEPGPLPVHDAAAELELVPVLDRAPDRDLDRDLGPDLPVHLPIDLLKQSASRLVRRYVQARSPAIADAVARHSAALALHPALGDAPEERAGFCRLTRHWRLLAAQCRLAASV